MPGSQDALGPHGARRLMALATSAVAAAGLLLAAPVAAVPAEAPVATSPPGGVPGVQVPELSWGPCPPEEQDPEVPVTGTFDCATATVPLDYADPGGQRIGLALKRRVADDQANRIGSLFLNPGGPGGSGVDVVSLAEYLYDPDVVASFDVIGFDPRGVARSTPLVCFESLEEIDEFYSPLPPFPVTLAQDRQLGEAFETLSRHCAQRGHPVMHHMSTGDVARDLDVLRAAVGDEQLSYAGYSYGTQLGVTYANLFPDRVRALVLDGVIDPIAWTTGYSPFQGRLQPVLTRLRSDEGAYATLRAFFRECGTAGPERCALAEGGHAEQRYHRLAAQLLVRPVDVEVEPGVTMPFTYQDLVDLTLELLYRPLSWPDLGQFVDQLADLRDSRTAGSAYQALRERAGLQEPVPQTVENLAGVLCADSDNPGHWSAWSVNGRLADVRAPYFGRLWTWGSIPCASWPVEDAGRYTGPWTAETANPILLVGNRYDPGTRYENAQLVDRLLPRSVLLTLEGAGHTALGLSGCVDAAVAAYLVDGVLPARDAACQPDVGPFDRSAAQRTQDTREQGRQEGRRQVIENLPWR